MAVELRVSGLGGTSVIIAAQHEWTMHEVKEALEVATQIPTWEQHLYADLEELRDSKLVSRLAASDGGVVELTLVRVLPDEGEWTARVGKQPLALAEAPPPIRANRDIVLVAARADIWSLAYAALELRSDQAFALELVQWNGSAIRHLPADFRSDRIIASAAVQQKGQALKDVGEDLKADPEIVLQAMRQDITALCHADGRLTADRTFILVAVLQDWRALMYASEDIREDPEVIRATARADRASATYASELLARCRGKSALGAGDEDDLWISVENARALFDSGGAAFLDARGPNEYEVSHVPGALQFPGDVIFRMFSLEANPAFQMLMDNPEMRAVVYSDSGSSISRCNLGVAMLRRKVGEEAAHRVIRLTGGLNAWKRAGHPVEGDTREFIATVPQTAGQTAARGLSLFWSSG